MPQPGTVNRKLYEGLKPAAEGMEVLDLRVGLGYVGVRLSNGRAGLAALLLYGIPRGCMVLPGAGGYSGSAASSLLGYLVHGKTPLEKAIGLATANAVIQPPPDALDDREATTLLNLGKGDRVVMVGLFSPLVPRIRATGATLTVLEKNPGRMEIPGEREKDAALRDCHVAIITGTTLLNGTFEETVAGLGSPRSVAVIGPSTPLLPEVFAGTPVTHLGGAVVMNPDLVLRVVSEAGGTPAMRPGLRYVNLVI